MWECVYLPIVLKFHSLDPSDMICYVDCVSFDMSILIKRH